MIDAQTQEPMNDQEEAGGGLDLALMAASVLRHWKAVVSVGLLAGVAGFGASYLIPLRYTAICVFLPPQSQSAGAASALASINNLSSLIGGGAGKNPPEQYVALMSSTTVADRIVKKFDLQSVFKTHFAVDARKRLAQLTVITVGKKDGLIVVEFTDTNPARAAAIANQYVTELRWMTTTLAVTEAQQRRTFFENLLQQTRDKLASAQSALESTGISAGAVNTEPRSAADAYSKLRAELTAAEVRLRVARTGLADSSTEVQRQQETVSALRSQIAKIEAHDQASGSANSDYVNRYREFKYEETLFDLFARQYESARVDESREGALIQVVDPATTPERKSGPDRFKIGAGAFVAGLLAASLFFAVRGYPRRAKP